MIKTQVISYTEGKETFKALVAMDDQSSVKRPIVLVAHDWSGRNEFADKKAVQLAELGYIGMALDVYGESKTAQTKEEKMALMKPLVEDRKLLLKRLQAGLHQATTLDLNNGQVAAIGFCFGGLCVLDLARSGADLKGVVSFHGLLNAPGGIKKEKVTSKVLVLQGHDDPMCTPDQVLAFEHEMTEAKTDWQTVIYSNTMHAFTNPQANDPGFGTVYNPIADKRSWVAMKSFFEEIFSP